MKASELSRAMTVFIGKDAERQAVFDEKIKGNFTKVTEVVSRLVDGLVVGGQKKEEALDEVLTALFENEGDLDVVEEEFADEEEDTTDDETESGKYPDEWQQYAAAGVPDAFLVFLATKVTDPNSAAATAILSKAAALSADADDQQAMANDPQSAFGQILTLLKREHGQATSEPAPAPAVSPRAAQREAAPPNGGNGRRFPGNLPIRTILIVGAVGAAIVGIVLLLVLAGPTITRAITSATNGLSPQTEAPIPEAPRTPVITVKPGTTFNNAVGITPGKSVTGSYDPCLSAKRSLNGPELTPGLEYIGVPLPNDSNCLAVQPKDGSWVAFFQKSDFANTPRPLQTQSLPVIAAAIDKFVATKIQVTNIVEPSLFKSPFPWGLVEWLFIITLVTLLPVALSIDIRARDGLGADDWEMVGVAILFTIVAAAFAKDRGTFQWVTFAILTMVAFVSTRYMDVSFVPLGGLLLLEGVVSLIPDMSIFIKAFSVPASGGVGLQSLQNPALMPTILMVLGSIVLGIDAVLVRRDWKVAAAAIVTAVSLIFFRIYFAENWLRAEPATTKTVAAFILTLLVTFVAAMVLQSSKGQRVSEGESGSPLDRIKNFLGRSTLSPGYLLTVMGLLLAILTWFPTQ